MKQILLLFLLTFSAFSGFSQTKHKLVKNIHWVDIKNPIPVDTTISLTHVYPEFDNEKNWKELIEKNHKRYYFYLLTLEK
jgi:hypothetical protein